jgi:hypothetical protein
LLKRSSGAPQEADEKPVGVGPARRHQQTLFGDKRRAAKKIGALALAIDRVSSFPPKVPCHVRLRGRTSD